MKTMYPHAGLHAVHCPALPSLHFTCIRLCWLLLLALLLTKPVRANYTVAAGSAVNAASIVAQSGTLVVNGTLTVNSNISLANFQTIIINAPAGRISWSNNVDLTLRADVNLVIASGAPGLQPLGGSASRRLIIGGVTMGVSNNNSNNAAFSFAELNNAGGLPQFTLSAPASACIGSSYSTMLTPLNNLVSYDCSFSITPNTGTIGPVTFTNFNSAVRSNITHTAPGTYTISCRVFKAGDPDLLTTKTTTIVVNALPATPTVSIIGPASICAGSTAQLTAISAGNNIEWYSSTNGGALLATNTSGVSWQVSPSGSTSYYATAVNAAGCTSALRSAPATIIVNPLPEVPTASIVGNNNICAGSSADIIANAAGNSIEWYTSAAGGTVVGTSLSGNNWQVSPMSSTSYYAAAVNAAGCTSAIRSAPVSVVVNPMPAAPTVSIIGAANICAGSTAQLIGSSSGNSIEWYTDTTAGNSIGKTASDAVFQVTPGNTTSYYAAAVSAAGCTSVSRSAPVTVLVDAMPASGVLSGGATNLCSGNNNTTLELTGYSGNILRWEESADNFVTASAISFNGDKYTVTNLNNTSSFRAVVGNGACGVLYSNPVTIAVIAPGTWLGVNNDWNSAANWCNGILPDSSTNVQINSGLAFYPVINGIAAANNIQLNGNGTSLQIQGGLLKLYGKIQGDQPVDARMGSIELSSQSPQTISASAFVNRTINRLIVSAASASIEAGGGMLNISNTLAFGNINNARITTNDLLTLLSRSNGTAAVADISNGGINSGNQVDGKLVIERFIPAQRKWRLLTAPIVRGSNVSIAESWQEAATPVTDPAIINSSNNPNSGYGTHITFGTPAVNGYDQNVNGNAGIFYITSKGWNGVPSGTNNATGSNTGNITDQQGYMVFVRGNRGTQLSLSTNAPASSTILRVKGAINQGRQTIPLGTIFTSGTARFRAIGNPYPSAINFHAIAEDPANKNAGIADAFYLWDANVPGSSNAGGWVGFSYNYATGSYDRTVLGSGTSNINTRGDIESGSAFMIDYSGTANSIVIDETHKAIGSSTNAFRAAAVATSSLRISLSKLKDQQTLLQDAALVSFHDVPAKAGANLAKIESNDAQIAVLLQRMPMAIARRNNICHHDSIAVLTKGLPPGQYQLQLEASLLSLPAGTICELVDAVTGEHIAAATAGSTSLDFTVDAQSTAATRRFTIVFTTPVHFTHAGEKSTATGQQMSWQVNNNAPVKQYEIQYAKEGNGFQTMANVSAATQQYNLQLPMGEWQCRIKAITDGDAIFSKAFTIQAGSTTQQPTLFPNPSEGHFMGILPGDLPAGKYEAQLLSATGTLIQRMNVLHHGNKAMLAIRPSATLATGMYQLILRKGNQQVAVLRVAVGVSK